MRTTIQYGVGAREGVGWSRGEGIGHFFWGGGHHSHLCDRKDELSYKHSDFRSGKINICIQKITSSGNKGKANGSIPVHTPHSNY